MSESDGLPLMTLSPLRGAFRKHPEARVLFDRLVGDNATVDLGDLREAVRGMKKSAKRGSTEWRAASKLLDGLTKEIAEIRYERWLRNNSVSSKIT